METGTLVFLLRQDGGWQVHPGESRRLREGPHPDRRRRLACRALPGSDPFDPDYVKLSRAVEATNQEAGRGPADKGSGCRSDFPANTIQQRAWLKSISDSVGGRA